MINVAVDAGLFTGFGVAKNTLAIIHLQLADDTLIFRGNDEDQIKIVKATLLCFEAVSGLRVTSHVFGAAFVCEVSHQIVVEPGGGKS